MLLKHFGLLTLINQSALSFGAAATAEFSNNGYEEIIQKAMESTDLRALHSKERTLGFLRSLEASETCVTETNAILEDVTIAAYIESLETDNLLPIMYNFDTKPCGLPWMLSYEGLCCNKEISSSNTECDVESFLTPYFQSLCENAGGQYFTMTMTMSHKKSKIVFKGIGSCGGASCDTGELIKEAKVKLGPIKREWESDGTFTVKISGSELRSVYFALVTAVISSFAFLII